MDTNPLPRTYQLCQFSRQEITFHKHINKYDDYWHHLNNNDNDISALWFSVENLAFKKDSWINKKTQYKRHIRHKLPEGHAERAVDGNLDLQLQSCTILDNLYGKYPLWTVDLGHKQRVSGVVIYTWQGDGQGKHVFLCLYSL